MRELPFSFDPLASVVMVYIAADVYRGDLLGLFVSILLVGVRANRGDVVKVIARNLVLLSLFVVDREVERAAVSL